MKTFLTILGCIFLSLPCFGQKHDQVWMFGRDRRDLQSDSLWGTSIIDFNDSPPKIYYEKNGIMDFQENSMAISDSEGNFLFSGNGSYLENNRFQKIEGSDFSHELNPEVMFQGNIVLPSENKHIYHYFSTTNGIVNIKLSGTGLNYSKINMAENGGLGKVVELDREIINDTLDHERLTAVKHGNGRDWWMFLRRANSNLYYSILFSEHHDIRVDTQSIGIETHLGLGTGVFSPDGKKYAVTSANNRSIGSFLDIYDFDRCTGILSNHIQIHEPPPTIAFGGAFSPNSRFFYTCSREEIYQYDMWADNIIDSKEIVAQYDGFRDTVWLSPEESVLVGTDFYLMQLGPDGKIYVGSGLPGSHSLHVIDVPNKKGIGCRVRQHKIKLPTVNVAMPFYPNYRLGALEDSPCDTIKISSVFDLENSGLVVYPNPTFGEIKIELDVPLSEAASFILYDLTGKEIDIMEFPKGQSEYQLFLSHPNGLYFYKIENRFGVLKSGKLIISQ